MINANKWSVHSLGDTRTLHMTQEVDNLDLLEDENILKFHSHQIFVLGFILHHSGEKTGARNHIFTWISSNQKQKNPLNFKRKCVISHFQMRSKEEIKRLSGI